MPSAILSISARQDWYLFYKISDSATKFRWSFLFLLISLRKLLVFIFYFTSLSLTCRFAASSFWTWSKTELTSFFTWHSLASRAVLCFSRSSMAGSVIDSFETIVLRRFSTSYRYYLASEISTFRFSISVSLPVSFWFSSSFFSASSKSNLSNYSLILTFSMSETSLILRNADSQCSEAKPTSALSFITWFI